MDFKNWIPKSESRENVFGFMQLYWRKLDVILDSVGLERTDVDTGRTTQAWNQTCDQLSAQVQPFFFFFTVLVSWVASTCIYVKFTSSFISLKQCWLLLRLSELQVLDLRSVIHHQATRELWLWLCKVAWWLVSDPFSFFRSDGKPRQLSGCFLEMKLVVNNKLLLRQTLTFVGVACRCMFACWGPQPGNALWLS